MACLSQVTRLIRFAGSKLTLCRTLSNVNVSNLNHSIPFLPKIPIAPTLGLTVNNAIKSPVCNNNVIQLPSGMFWVPPIENPVCTNTLEAPASINSGITKQAARLIVIRRKKMRKHKLRKLRKRMKFEWAKVRQRREMRKEKLFQSILIQQCKDGEAFSAEQYVEERISELNRQPVVINYRINPNPKV